MRVLVLWLAFLGPLQTLDDGVQAAVQRLRTPTLERPVRTLTDVGRPVVVLGALLLIAAFDAAAGPATARLALAALIPTNLAVEGLKHAIGRTRPDGDRKRSNSSFPSSHAANAFALAFVLARRYRRAAALLVLFAVGVAFSRMYLNRHYASDVVAGAAIGTLCAWWAARWLAARAARGHPPPAVRKGLA
jgi:undecaprenyl-diphosphatase